MNRQPWTQETIDELQLHLRDFYQGKDHQFKFFKNQIALYYNVHKNDSIIKTPKGTLQSYRSPNLHSIHNPPPYVDQYKVDPVTMQPVEGEVDPYLVNLSANDVLNKYNTLRLKYELVGYIPTPQDAALEISLEMVKTMMEEKTCQVRTGTLVQNLMACLATANHDDKYSIALLFCHELLLPYDTLPFEEDGKINRFFEDSKIVTVLLPLLLISVTYLFMQEVTNTISPYHAQMYVDQLVKYGSINFQNKYLKSKNLLRGWFQITECSLNKYPIAQWTNTGKLSTPIYRTSPYREDTEAVAKFLKNLSDSDINDEIKQFVKDCMKINDPFERQKAYVVCRVLSSNGTYIASDPRITMQAAVGARIHDIPASIPIKKYVQLGQGSSPLEYDTRSIDLYRRMDNVAAPIISKATSLLEGTDFEGRVSSFWTSNSAGAVEIQKIDELHPLINAALGKRIVNAAANAGDFLDKVKLENAARAPKLQAARDAQQRRPRDVVMSPNAISFCHYPIYLAIDAMLTAYDTGASGKQVGNYKDLIPMLIWTGMLKYFKSFFSDVSGMDASILRPLTLLLYNYAIRVLAPLKIPVYGPFKTTVVNVITNESGTGENQEQLEVNALVHMMLSMLGIFDGKSTVLVAKPGPATGTLIKAVMKLHEKGETAPGAKYYLRGDTTPGKEIIYHTADQTFSSGLPETSTHHSVLLTLLVLVVKMKLYEKKGRLGIIDKHVHLGDDQAGLYQGSEDDIREAGEVMAEVFAEAGFELESASSTHFCEFLQQGAYLGRFLGYADRISPCSIERKTPTRDQLEAITSQKAILDDLSNRVEDPAPLYTFLKMIWFYSILPVSIRVDALVDIKSLIRSDMFQATKGRILIRVRSKKKDVELNYDSSDSAINEAVLMISNSSRAVAKENNKTLPLKDVIVAMTLFPPVTMCLTYGTMVIIPNDIVDVSGSIRMAPSCYTPPGELSDYWITLLSIPDDLYKAYNTERLEVKFARPETLMDVNYIKKMKLDVGYALAQILRKTRLTDMRSRQVTKDEKFQSQVNELGRRANYFGEDGPRISSYAATNRLRTSGLDVPEEYRYYMRNKVRIELTALTSADKERDYSMLKSELSSSILEFKRNSKCMSVTGRDFNKFMFRIFWKEGSILQSQSYKKLYSSVWLSTNVRFNTVAGLMFAGLGLEPSITSTEIRALAIISDRRSPWGTNAKFAEYVLSLSPVPSPSQLRDLCIANGMSERLQQQFLHNFYRSEHVTNSVFKNTVSPRLLFFWDGNTPPPKENYIVHPNGGESRDVRAFESLTAVFAMTMYPQMLITHKPYSVIGQRLRRQLDEDNRSRWV
uniref:Replicase n=1 Tax=Thrips tabaci associated reovirus 1 TaxID=2771483 RepID=A0A7H1D336_9REOV|nr:replicase [Thrips tabaci associated reovirus 1]